MRTTPTFGPITCEHCEREIWHPRWRRYEHHEYVALCAACNDAVGWLFELQDVFEEAAAIIRAYQLLLNGGK